MTKIYDWKNEIKEDELNSVIDTLKDNGLVILPTETVYGLAASAFSNDACKNIFIAKGRAQDNPLIVHVSSKKMIYDIVEKPTEIEEKLIDSFMPGPFTLILKKKPCICDTVTCNSETVGIRMPIHPIIHKIIDQSNIPLAAPSANISGKPSGTCVDDIKEEFNNKVDLIVDGGKCNIGIESTVVKVIDNVPVILRPGFITEDDIKKVIGNVKLSDKLFTKVTENEKVESPGMKYRHYAPKTKCILVEQNNQQVNKINKLISDNSNCCVLGFSEDADLIHISKDKFICLGSKNNLQEISSNIFTCLRKVDTLNCSFAIIEGLEKKNLGLSIMNRLVRACENNVI
ncbi:MAG: threonylcarbamoyl-AMP synthase [Clostridia bacterium]|nr:threonylcarbamoyl-AMP synthase [Clostridia bacterium]